MTSIPHDFNTGLTRFGHKARHVARAKAQAFVAGVLCGMVFMAVMVMWVDRGAP